MEITKVEPIRLERALDTITRRGGTSEQNITVTPVVVKIHTDEGITGIGESFVFDPTGEEAKFLESGINALSKKLVGQDPLNVTQRWHEMYVEVKRSGAYRALSAVDEALWDIKGKNAGEPVYELLGGQVNEIKAYATFPHFKESEQLIEDAVWLSEKGFEAIKIVGASVGVEHDRERIRTISENLPEEMDLAIDVNTSYNAAEALAVAETASEHDLAWFEEPISHLDVQGMAELNERVSVPIAAYQTQTPHYPAVEHLRAGALEIYQPTLDLVGGITAANRVATLVEAFNKQLVPHTFGPLVNYAASMHVVAASPACSLIEFAVFDDEIDDPGEFIASPYVKNQDAVYVQDGGTISPPEGPGLGIELDEDKIEEYRV